MLETSPFLAAPAALSHRSGEQERLLHLYYDEVRRLARRVLNGQGGALALQPTDLANEAAIRLLKSSATVTDRAHFLALAARVLRQVLIDEVRRARSLKRTPDPVQTLWRSAQGEPIALDIEAVNGAVEELAKASPEHARFVELRFFVGLTLEETAEACGVSLATAKRRWQAARAWLFEALRAP